jgi:signal peptidase I
MTPTLHEGDIIVLRESGDPRVGNIIAVQHEGVTFIKRLMGTGGDKVSMNSGDLVRNGKLMWEYDIQENHEWHIPDGKILILGDNQSDSRDSRRFGLLDETKIVGRGILRLWPPKRI